MVKLRARKSLNPERRKGFSVFQNSSELFWVPPSSISNRYQGSFLGVKLPRCKFDSPSSAKDKNEWMNVTMCVHGVNRDNRTLALHLKNYPTPVVYFRIVFI